MVNYLSFSQSLIPSVIKIDSTKYYCYDSVSIRKVAVCINNSFTCDSIVNEYKILIKDYSKEDTIQNQRYYNLQSQLKNEIDQNNLQEKETEVYKKELKIQKNKNRLLIVGIVVETTLVVLKLLISH